MSYLGAYVNPQLLNDELSFMDLLPLVVCCDN